MSYRTETAWNGDVYIFDKTNRVVCVVPRAGRTEGKEDERVALVLRGLELAGSEAAP